MPALQINVLHAQPATLHEPQSRPVHQPSHQGVRFRGRHLIKGEQQLADLRLREDERHPHGSPRPHRIESPDVDFQHLLVKKQQCRQRLILCARRDIAFDGQMRQKLLDFEHAHRIGMLDAMKADIALRPVDVSPLGPNGEMLDPRDVTDLIQQLHNSPPFVGNIRLKWVLPGRSGMLPANTASSV